MTQSGNETPTNTLAGTGPEPSSQDEMSHEKRRQRGKFRSDPRLAVKPVQPIQRQGKALDPAITEELVSELVEQFYSRVRQHPRLAALFAGGMSLDWPEHLDIMKAFWRSMLMQTREYDGRPVPAHMKMQDLTPQDFADWLSLFRQTAQDICPPSAATLFIDRAQTIARNLQMALFFAGQVLPKDAFEDGVLRRECETNENIEMLNVHQ